MSSGRRALAALVLLALALGLAACGGGSGESDEEQVEAVIKTALTSTDPSACGESRTIDFMEETGESTGAEAERECEKAVASRENLPNSVKVSKIEVEDGKATAEVHFEGGDPDGLVVNVVVVEEDGNWKIDDFTDLAGLDRDRFTARIEKAFEHEGLGRPEVSCLVAALNKLPEDEFEELALGGDEEAITEISERCETEIAAEQVSAKAEREAEQEELAEFEEELEAEAPAEYPRAVKQNFLKRCLATSGSDFATCECTLAALESNYTVQEIQQAEANIASGRMREMVESAVSACA
jgi:hypothetical protein